VATALAPEHEHEIGRGGDQAAEVRRLPASCGDEPEREEHGGDEASETEDELVVIRLVMFRSARVAIVCAASRETFEVTAARIRSRSTGSTALRCSPAVRRTAVTGRFAR
jgi:hypothetical protein